MARGFGDHTSGSCLLFGQWVNSVTARRELIPIVVELYKGKEGTRPLGVSSIAVRLRRQGCGISRAMVIHILRDAGEDMSENKTEDNGISNCAVHQW